jgi:hypothetical protein
VNACLEEVTLYKKGIENKTNHMASCEGLSLETVIAAVATSSCCLKK